ncbi:MAG: tRNA lysidine(34) synthetase TilS [Clostridia bacterium]
MKSIVLETIRRYHMLEQKDVVWVALSGGPDSVCLLHLLNDLRDRYILDLKAVHVNHGLRGEDSLRDEAFCQSLCEKMGVPLHVHRVDVGALAKKQRTTIEEAGRMARHEAFDACQPGKIALGHTMDDQAETILMNLLRGCGLEGLTGMGAVSRRIIRPLFHVRKSQVLEYLKKAGIPHMTDESNQDIRHSRNRVRHEVIPFLNKAVSGDTVKTLARMGELLQKDEEIVREAADAMALLAIEEKQGVIHLDNMQLKQMKAGLRGRVIRLALEKARGTLKDIEQSHTAQVEKIILLDRTGESIHLPGGFRALVQFGKTVVYDESVEVSDFEIPLRIPGETHVREVGITIRAEVLEGTGEDKDANESMTLYLDHGTAMEGLVVRRRRNGDIIDPSRGAGSKKLKKYLIDRKIHRMDRDRAYVIAGGNRIAYLSLGETGRDFQPVGPKQVKLVIQEDGQCTRT